MLRHSLFHDIANLIAFKWKDAWLNALQLEEEARHNNNEIVFVTCEVIPNSSMTYMCPQYDPFFSASFISQFKEKINFHGY